MHLEEIQNLVYIVACICAHDGEISHAEFEKMYELFVAEYPEFSKDDFDETISNFLLSDENIRACLEKVTDPSMREFALKTAHTSASVDGFDLRENIVLEKIRFEWDII